MRDPKSILLVRLSAVGDVINCLPAVSAIRARHPEARIGFVVEDRAEKVLVGHPEVDRVHLYPRRRWVKWGKNPLRWGRLAGEIIAFVRALRSERYDVALDLQGNMKGAAHAILSGARTRIGFARGHSREWNHLLHPVQVDPPPTILNRVDKFLFMAASIGAEGNGARYRLPDSPESRDRVKAFREQEGLEEYVVLHPGTSEFGRAKRWPPDRFVQVVKELQEKKGIRSVITWGPGEEELAREIVEGCGEAAVLSMKTKSLLDLAELIRNATLFIGCDSGPLHLSSAVETPSVAIFGPKDPRVYGPYNPRSRTVSPPSSDLEGERLWGSVEDVFQAASELLSK
jgi:lipopolysaccharide heptosyltransferase I